MPATFYHSLSLSRDVAERFRITQAVGAYKAKDYPACARLYGQQADRTPPVRGAAYDAACCLALAGDKEAALARLAATPSDQLRSHIADDADLTPTPELQKSLYVVQPLPQKIERVRTRAWTSIKSGT